VRLKRAGRQVESLDIRPVGDADLDAVLEVYRQCEDFLALGPVSYASPGMVQADLKLSRGEGGVFCGVYEQGTMVGIVDFVPGAFQGDPRHACLSLLMIAAPHRHRGLGRAVVEWVEGEIRQNPAVRSILSGVQVNNPAAIRFWQRMGYRIVSGPEDMPDGTTVYRLEKQV
jgi:ribosomal protein S18 acetylase RimI-like enzyme